MENGAQIVRDVLMEGRVLSHLQHLSFNLVRKNCTNMIKYTQQIVAHTRATAVVDKSFQVTTQEGQHRKSKK